MCEDTPHKYHPEILQEIFFRIAHSPNSQKWKCFDSLSTSVPKFSIFHIHPSTPFVSSHSHSVKNSVPFHCIPLNSIHVTVLLVHFISIHFTSLLICICSFGLSLPCVSKLRLCLLIVWVFEALCRRTIWLHFSGTLPGATAFSCYP